MRMIAALAGPGAALLLATATAAAQALPGSAYAPGPWGRYRVQIREATVFGQDSLHADSVTWDVIVGLSYADDPDVGEGSLLVTLDSVERLPNGMAAPAAGSRDFQLTRLGPRGFAVLRHELAHPVLDRVAETLERGLIRLPAPRAQAWTDTTEVHGRLTARLNHAGRLVRTCRREAVGAASGLVAGCTADLIDTTAAPQAERTWVRSRGTLEGSWRLDADGVPESAVWTLRVEADGHMGGQAFSARGLQRVTLQRVFRAPR